MESEQMTSPTSSLRARIMLCAALGMAAVLVVGAPRVVDAQGLVKGVEKGAREGNKAAGPVGGVVGVVTGKGDQPAQADKDNKDKESKDKKGAPKTAKAPPAAAKGAKQPVQVLTQEGAPKLTAEQIVVNSDANIDRIKTELNLTPEQEKNWSSFASAMHYLGHNGADRLNLRIARAQRDPPDDIIEQMRNEAQFLVDRAQDQRNVADAAEPLYVILDNKQKQIFIDEMVRLSHERGLD